jgi:NADPH:quinone reductase
MQAIVVKHTGGPEVLVLKEVARPKPTGEEVLVQIKSSGVNFIDIYFRTGQYTAKLPFTPGQEGAGVVVELGPEATGLKIGDRVAYAGTPGSYAQYALVPASRLVPIPDRLSDDFAAAAMLQGMTAHYLSHDTFALKKGNVCVVHAAAGGVGQLLVQMACLHGARVIALVSSPEKAELARKAGAHEVLPGRNRPFAEEVKKLTGGKGADVVYDSVGKTTFMESLKCLRPRGMMVLFGGASGAVPPFDPTILTNNGSLFLTRPRLNDYIASREDLLKRSGAIFNLIAGEKVRLAIDATYPLAKAAEAHKKMESRGTTGKLILHP